MPKQFQSLLYNHNPHSSMFDFRLEDQYSQMDDNFEDFNAHKDIDHIKDMLRTNGKVKPYN